MKNVILFFVAFLSIATIKAQQSAEIDQEMLEVSQLLRNCPGNLQPNPIIEELEIKFDISLSCIMENIMLYRFHEHFSLSENETTALEQQTLLITEYFYDQHTALLIHRDEEGTPGNEIHLEKSITQGHEVFTIYLPDSAEYGFVEEEAYIISLVNDKTHELLLNAID
ncbi:MAG TPA: hypothetical protein P5514_04815 [Bacteroidales bacterium]|nr:hypothetical protein [Bacteroidales bacterium]HRX96243.1 hypothetical protein [Bacteroidales bacterium]